MKPFDCLRLAPLLVSAALLAGCPAATAPVTPLATGSTTGTAPDGPAPTGALDGPTSPAAPSPAVAVYDAPRITPEAAKARMDAGEEILLVDVRDPSVYLIERLKGALSAPWADIRASKGLPPKDKLLLLYCT